MSETSAKSSIHLMFFLVLNKASDCIRHFITGMSEPETSLNSNDDLFRGFFNGMDDLIDVVPGQSSDVFSTSLMSTKSGRKRLLIFVEKIFRDL